MAAVGTIYSYKNLVVTQFSFLSLLVREKESIKLNDLFRAPCNSQAAQRQPRTPQCFPLRFTLLPATLGLTQGQYGEMDFQNFLPVWYMLCSEIKLS